MARPSRRGARDAERPVAVALLVVALVIAAGLVALYLRAERQHVTLDPETRCPAKGEPSAYFLVLLDVTDPFNDVQRASIRRELEALWGDVPPQGELRVYGLAFEDEAPATELFRGCNPGSAEGSDPLTQNPARLRRRFEAYLTELRGLEGSWLQWAGAPSSPILEAIQSVALELPLRAERPRHLLLVSDLLQNSARLSFYEGNGVPDFESFAQTPAYPRLMADVRGFEVEVLYVRRDGDEPERLQRGRSLVHFWEAYLGSLGATLERVKQVEG